MHVLVTGSEGFIGKNLVITLEKIPGYKVSTFNRDDDLEKIDSKIVGIDTIIHLAGENRPKLKKEFEIGNYQLTKLICDTVKKSGKIIPIIFTSSTQAEENNPYGKSKLAAENVLKDLQKNNKNPVIIYRLPGVFGKWSKPNYNSVVATFCFNIANKLPIKVNDPKKTITLVYIDDVINSFLSYLEGSLTKEKIGHVYPEYSISLENLANQIKQFADSRNTLVTDKVGQGLKRALYSTYLSFLPPEKFIYSIPFFPDDRGMFAEVLKTKDSGQISVFTAFPGITRGEHYHHSKSEKFLVIHGKAMFRFRNLITNKKYEILTSSKKLQIVESIPGWVHDITNIGDHEMIVMLWANEIFNRDEPDTIAGDVEDE